MNWNSLRQPHAVAIIAALLVHGTADAQGSASEILVPAKITSVLTIHSRLVGTTCYRKRQKVQLRFTEQRGFSKTPYGTGDSQAMLEASGTPTTLRVNAPPGLPGEGCRLPL